LRLLEHKIWGNIDNNNKIEDDKHGLEFMIIWL